MTSQKESEIVDISNFNSNDKRALLLDSNPEDMIRSIVGRKVYALRSFNSGPIMPLLHQIINSEMINHEPSRDIPQYSIGSLFDRMTKTPNNKEVFLERPPRRYVEMCVIIMTELEEKQLLQAKKMLEGEKYTKWKQVMFVKDKQEPKIENNFVTLTTSGNQIRNIEVAVTQHCDHKGYALLMNLGEKFSMKSPLISIADSLADRDIVGAAVNIETNESLIRPPYDLLLPFNRVDQAIVSPMIKNLHGILNHMRIFAIESFRYIPQFNLRNINGEYFEDRLIFLMTLLEIVRTKIEDPIYLYLGKKYQHSWNMPRRLIFLNDTVVLTNVK